MSQMALAESSVPAKAEAAPPKKKHPSIPRKNRARRRPSRSPLRTALAKPMPTCLSWLVQKVVAIGMPSAWRKVLYCIEAMKFTSTCTKWWGQDKGMNPTANSARHSKATK